MSSKVRSTSAEERPSGPVSVEMTAEDRRVPPLDLPPILAGRAAPSADDAHRTAIRQASLGQSGAGDLWWSADQAKVAFSIVLEPSVGRARCYEMLPLVMVAFAEALGALSPPEVAVQHRWPATILVNGADAGRARLALAADDGPDGLPRWSAVGLEIALALPVEGPEPGFDLQRTTLAEEGCGAITGRELIEVTARHFLAWLDAWEQEGFAPVHRQWTFAWADNARDLRVAAGDGTIRGQALGIDEHGGLLLKTAGGTVGIDLARALSACGEGEA